MVNANEKWEPVDYVDLRRGDDVRLTHGGGTVLYGRVLDGAIEVLATRTTSALSWWRALGFSVERAVPERTPPTEDGLFASNPELLNATLYSRLNGHWQCDKRSKWDYCPTSEVPDDLVRLVPVTEVEELRKRIEKADEYLAAQHRETEIGDVRPTLTALLYGEAADV